MISSIKQQVKEFWVDVFDRVDWPKPEKVRSATVAVVLVAVFVGVFLYGSDRGITFILSSFMPSH